jgi:hypothetical protein
MAGIIRPVTTRIEWREPSAQVTIGAGFRRAAAYWAATVDRWSLPVLAVALASGLTAWLFRYSLSDQETLSRFVRMSALGTPVDPGTVPGLVAGPLAVASVTLVAGWFMTANAVAGLRGREITLPWVLAGGLRSFVVDLLLGSIVALVVVAPLLLGVVGLLVLALLLPLLVYLLVRLSFWTYAVFDGERIGEAGVTSWNATRRSVLRVLGWSLALVPLSVALSIGNVIVDLVIGPVSRPVAEAVTAGAGATLTSFTVVMLAVLYESQRARMVAPPRAASGVRAPLDPPPPPGPPWG